MSPTRLIQLSSEQLGALRNQVTHGGGKPSERLLSLVVVAVAIVVPVLLVLSRASPLATFH